MLQGHLALQVQRYKVQENTQTKTQALDTTSIPYEHSLEPLHLADSAPVSNIAAVQGYHSASRSKHKDKKIIII